MGNDLCISLLFCTSNKKIFFANINRIALNLNVHRNEYNSTTKIMHQQLTCRNEFKAILFLLWLKRLPEKSFVRLAASAYGKKLFTITKFKIDIKIAITIYVNTWTSWGQVLDKFNKSICNKFIRWCCMSDVCTTSFSNGKMKLFQGVGAGAHFCVFSSSFSWQKIFYPNDFHILMIY